MLTLKRAQQLISYADCGVTGPAAPVAIAVATSDGVVVACARQDGAPDSGVPAAILAATDATRSAAGQVLLHTFVVQEVSGTAADAVVGLAGANRLELVQHATRICRLDEEFRRRYLSQFAPQ